MISWRGFAAALLAAPLLAAAGPQMAGRAHEGAAPPSVSLRLADAETSYRWDDPPQKAATARDPRRLAVGTVRPAEKAFGELPWRQVAGGHVARFDVLSRHARGLRVRLDLAAVAGAKELRVRDAAGRTESMPIPVGATLVWGPWTEGDAQAVEVFAPVRPAPGAVRLGAIVHFDRDLDMKAAASCTIDTLCSTGDTVLDAAIAERKKAVARILFVDGATSFVCTGTLLDSEKHPAPYFLTANHCIGRAEVAASITSLWFYEASACGSGQAGTDRKQVAGGMQVVLADPNTDQTLLLMNAPPPAGAVFSGWNATRLDEGASATSLSHPAGDVSKWALATVAGTARFPEWEQSAWLTRFSRGIIQGGSSGSGLFTLAGGGLQIRAVLSASTSNAQGDLSCANSDAYGVYNRFDVFYPQVARYLMADPPPVTDDHGNRPSEATAVSLRATPTTVSGRIDYPGDVDVFRFDVVADGTLVAYASGGADTVGVLLDASGQRITSNDDAQAGAFDFGITRRLAPGTYYLAVTHWESAQSADYALHATFLPVAENYTDLWWNPAESGWGINLNHQGSIIFGTLFTYDDRGAPLWLVLPSGARQPDGTFEGTLYRTTGPPFDATTWTQVAIVAVGQMRLSFPERNAARLSYGVDGVTVTKDIERQRFSPRVTTCSWSAFDRSYASNFQDLWWNPSEPGWGINFTHQGDTLFATLFTYDSSGRGTWFVMSDGPRQAGTMRFSGTLFRTTGQRFDTVPWASVSAEAVGTMSVEFENGNSATLSYTVGGVPVTKKIERQVFASPAVQCEDVDG